MPSGTKQLTDPLLNGDVLPQMTTQGHSGVITVNYSDVMMGTTVCSGTD